MVISFDAPWGSCFTQPFQYWNQFQSKVGLEIVKQFVTIAKCSHKYVGCLVFSTGCGKHVDVTC